MNSDQIREAMLSAVTHLLRRIDGTPAPPDSPAAAALWAMRRAEQQRTGRDLRLEQSERFAALLAWADADPSRAVAVHEAIARVADKKAKAALPYLLSMVQDDGSLVVYQRASKSNSKQQTSSLAVSDELRAEVERRIEERRKAAGDRWSP